MSLAAQAKTEAERPTFAHPVVVGGIIGVAYVLAGFLGPWIQAQPDRAITPAAGIAMAALLIFGIRYGVVVWIAAVGLFLWNGMAFVPAALTGAVCALEAMMGALLLQGTGCRLLLDRVRDVASFGVLGVLASPAFGAFVGGPLLLLTGEISSEALGGTIMTWWLSDAVGILLVAPVILALVVARSRDGWPRWWPLEAGLGLSATALIAVALFGGRAPEELAQAALLIPLPFLLWGIFRFGLHGAAFVMATVAGVVVWSSAAGAGPFAAGAGAGNVDLWIYLITLGFVGLVTWALVAEHRSALVRFEAVFDNSSEGIIIFHHGRVAHCNAAAVHLFGTRAAERLIERDVDELSPLEQPDGTHSSQGLRAHMAEADRKAGGHRFEWALERQDGTTFPAEVSLSRVEVAGSPGYLAIIRDMSDQVARQQALEAARDEARAANKAKTAYLAEVSHKIRTALNTNLGFARMIARDESLPAKHQEYVQKVLTSGKALLELVDDVLERSRIEADRLGASTATAFDPRELLGGVTEMFEVAAEKKETSFDLVVDENVPHRIVSEQRRLEQVLTLLVGKAVKSTSEGTISVTMAVGESDVDPEAVPLIVEVADTGAGLRSSEVEELFERSDEPGMAESDAPGLPEARETARDMGGDLTVESELGHGTRFRLKVVARRPGPEDQESEGPRRMTKLAPGQKPFRILIVDDTEENRTLLQGLLTRVGFETRTAADGREALSAFGAWDPDLILMDQKMPTMDGTEATRRIRASEQGRRVPIIMVTAAGFGVDREELMAGGADGFVRVPFHETELLREIGKHLDVRYAEEE